MPDPTGPDSTTPNTPWPDAKTQSVLTAAMNLMDSGMKLAIAAEEFVKKRNAFVATSLALAEKEPKPEEPTP